MLDLPETAPQAIPKELIVKIWRESPRRGEDHFSHQVPSLPPQDSTMTDLDLVLLTPHPLSPSQSMLLADTRQTYLHWHFSGLKVLMTVLGIKLKCGFPEVLHVYRVPS